MKKVCMCTVIGFLVVSLYSMVNAADNNTKQKDPVGKEAPTTQAFKNDVDEISYAIGMNYGQQLKSGIDSGYLSKINIPLLQKALEDAVNGKKLAMTKEQQDQAINKLRVDAAERRKKMAEDNLAKAKKFLEENKKKTDVKTTNSGLQYTIIKEGTGPAIKASDIVKIHYRIFVDDKEQDSSYKTGKPAEVPAGALPPGWSEGLQLMKVGSKAKLFLPPELAGGDRGMGPGMPPNALVVIELDVLDIMPTPTPMPTPTLMPTPPVQPGTPKK